MPPNPTFKKREAKTTIDMDVSKNRGTPKSSILIGFSIINHPFWGTSIFGNTHMKEFPCTIWLLFHLFIIGHESWGMELISLGLWSEHVIRQDCRPRDRWGNKPRVATRSESLPKQQETQFFHPKNLRCKVLHQKAVEENHMVQVALDVHSSAWTISSGPIAKVLPWCANVWLNWILRETVHSHIRIKIYNQFVVLSMMPLKLDSYH